MGALADLEDVPGSEAFDQAQKVETLKALERASTRVRTHCHREFDRQVFTTRIRAIGGWLRLAQTPVIEVTEVKVLVNGNPTSVVGYTWDGLDRVWVGSLGIVVNLPEDVMDVLRWGTVVADVTYEAGYDPIPDAVVEVVAGLAARSLALPMNGMVTQQTAGPFTMNVAAWASGGPLSLSQADKDTLAPYRRSRSTIELGVT